MECKIDFWNDVESGTCNPYFKIFPLFSNKKWMSTKESAKIFQHRLTKKLFIEDFFSTRFNIVNEQRGLPLRIFYFKFRFRWLKIFLFFRSFFVSNYIALLLSHGDLINVTFIIGKEICIEIIQVPMWMSFVCFLSSLRTLMWQGTKTWESCKDLSFILH